MENASKALIIAGGILIALMLVTLLVFSFKKYSEYQTSKDELADIQDTADFNEQFLRYDRNDVKGYELISLANRIIDFNKRMSTTGNNDIKYSPMEIKIYNVDSSKFVFNESKIPTKDRLIQQKTDYNQNSFKQLTEEAEICENKFGGTDAANKLAKNLGTIYDTYYFDTSQYTQEQIIDKELLGEKTFKRYCKTNIPNWNSKNTRIDLQKCYEYMQLKRGVFRCTDKIYDKTTGRIKSISFEFTGEIY